MRVQGIQNPETILINLLTNLIPLSDQRNAKQRTILVPPVGKNKHVQAKRKAMIDNKDLILH